MRHLSVRWPRVVDHSKPVNGVRKGKTGHRQRRAHLVYVVVGQLQRPQGGAQARHREELGHSDQAGVMGRRGAWATWPCKEARVARSEAHTQTYLLWPSCSSHSLKFAKARGISSS